MSLAIPSMVGLRLLTYSYYRRDSTAKNSSFADNTRTSEPYA
jgi:hypothetical protein